MPRLTGLKHCFQLFYDCICDDSRFAVDTVSKVYAQRDRRNDKVNIALRHDVDLSLNLALPLAEFEAEQGLRASYYFLTDTAPYDVWNSDVPRRLVEIGHEVGLHSDHMYEQCALGRDGLARLREDVKRLSDAAGAPVEGVIWHGGRHILPYETNNYELYRELDAAELGVEYHDAILYHPGTTKWCAKALLTDGENNLRFVPNKVKSVLASLNPGEDLLFVGHPENMFHAKMRAPLSYPPYPNLKPPRTRTFLMDMKSCLAYNKAYLGPRKTRWLRSTIQMLERFSPQSTA